MLASILAKSASALHDDLLLDLAPAVLEACRALEFVTGKIEGAHDEMLDAIASAVPPDVPALSMRTASTQLAVQRIAADQLSGCSVGTSDELSAGVTLPRNGSLLDLGVSGAVSVVTESWLPTTHLMPFTNAVPLTAVARIVLRADGQEMNVSGLNDSDPLHVSLSLHRPQLANGSAPLLQLGNGSLLTKFRDSGLTASAVRGANGTPAPDAQLKLQLECVFWNSTAGDWSTSGVRLESVSSNSMVCAATHLSSFAARLVGELVTGPVCTHAHTHTCTLAR